MNYEEFDIGNFEDELCNKIMKALQTRPMTANELAIEIFGDEFKIYMISPKLQKLKKVNIISNVKNENNIYYWGAEKKYRKMVLQ